MKWMFPQAAPAAPFLAVFRLLLDAATQRTLDFDYSADESCQLFLDGKLLAAGPDRGAPELWFTNHVRVQLSPGKHALTARLLAFGQSSAACQMTVRHGFYCTLPGSWEAMVVPGLSFFAPKPDWGSVPRVEAGRNYPPDILRGRGKGWRSVEYFEDNRNLVPSELPPLLGKRIRAYQQEGDRFLFDDYVCVWPSYRFDGKGTVRFRWAECGYLTSGWNPHTLKGEKGQRNGRYLQGNADVLHVNGHLDWEDLQWRAGRILEVKCSGSARLTAVSFRANGYPLPPLPSCRKDRGLLKMAYRTLQCCTHDTFMDCPFYERMMYIGDCRVEALCLYALGGNPAIARKAIRFTALHQLPNGMIPSRYPARVFQYIPSFVPIWILMLDDYAMATQDLEFVEEMLPVARRIVRLFQNSLNEDGLIHLDGWQFVDWQWPDHGIPFGSECGTNSIINLLVCLALCRLACLEERCGHSAVALEYRDFQGQLMATVRERYFDQKKGLYSDDQEHHFFSEHAQVLALLMEDRQTLKDSLAAYPFQTTCGINFSHYYLEACHLHGLRHLFERRLERYRELSLLGLRTLPENFILPRSDCHAWSAHVLYHLLRN